MSSLYTEPAQVALFTGLEPLLDPLKHIVMEQWEFQVESDKDNKKIKSKICDIIRQTTVSVTFLTLLNCDCSFDILVYTHKEFRDTRGVSGE